MLNVTGYIIYFIWKSSKEANVRRETIEELERDTMSLALWLNKVTDQELERKISYYNYKEEILAVLKSIPYFDVIEEDYNKQGALYDNIIEFMILHCSYNHFFSGDKIIKRICMGLQGKLLYDDAWKGIESPPVYNEEYKRLWRFNHELMKWLETQLSVHGVKENMYFKTNIRHQWSPDELRFIKVDDECPMSGGIYYWMPMSKFSVPSCAEELIKNFSE